MVARRIGRAMIASIPTRERLAQSRVLRPVAHHVLAPALWRFTRRSVPRGVALGTLVGIVLMVPGLQAAGATLLALPLRANIPLAVGMTFLSNPATTPLILAAALWLGNVLFGYRADISHFAALIERGAGMREWLDWLLTDAAPATLAGLSVIGLVSAVLGYVVADLLWRWRVARRWKKRSAARPVSVADAMEVA